MEVGSRLPLHPRSIHDAAKGVRLRVEFVIGDDGDCGIIVNPTRNTAVCTSGFPCSVMQLSSHPSPYRPDERPRASPFPAGR